MYDAMQELYKHRQQFGTMYKLPDGSMALIKDKNIKKFLSKNHLQIKSNQII